MYQMDNAERKILHPFIADIVNEKKPQTVLDYGCGDAYLSQLINPEAKIYLFDKNSTSLKNISKERAWARCIPVYNEDQIKTQYFDYIIYSQVMMCIATQEEQLNILQKLYSYKKAAGKLIAVITHPCFLQYKFGHWYTSYSEHQVFNYMKEAEPYSVFMKRSSQTPLVFTDYNWPMSSILNLFFQSGFRLEKMIEHKDMPYIKEGEFNKLIPHYMFLIFS